MFQLILNPIRDWNNFCSEHYKQSVEFQLILNPIRDWNTTNLGGSGKWKEFQLILNPTRDWNLFCLVEKAIDDRSN